MQFLEAAKSIARVVSKAARSGRTREPFANEKESKRRSLLLEEDERATVANQVRRRAKHRSASPEEIARARRFVGIAFRGPTDDRRAWIPWAGLDVWEIVEDSERTGYDLLVEEEDIPKKAIDLALAYHEAYPEGIDRTIEENRRSPEEWHRLFPHVDVAPRRD